MGSLQDAACRRSDRGLLAAGGRRDKRAHHQQTGGPHQPRARERRLSGNRLQHRKLTSGRTLGGARAHEMKSQGQWGADTVAAKRWVDSSGRDFILPICKRHLSRCPFRAFTFSPTIHWARLPESFPGTRQAAPTTKPRGLPDHWFELVLTMAMFFALLLGLYVGLIDSWRF